jgi:hypothetical protein
MAGSQIRYNVFAGDQLGGLHQLLRMRLEVEGQEKIHRLE